MAKRMMVMTPRICAVMKVGVHSIEVNHVVMPSIIVVSFLG